MTTSTLTADLKEYLRTKASIRSINANLRSLNAELKDSALMRSINKAKDRRAELRTALELKRRDIAEAWPAGGGVLQLNNTGCPPQGLLNITLEPQLSVNMNQKFLQQFTDDTKLKVVKRTYAEANQKKVPVFRKVKVAFAGTGKSSGVIDSSSADDSSPDDASSEDDGADE